MKDYYTWENEKESIEQREEKISDYLTEDLQALTTDMIRDDIPTSSSVSDIDIWSVSQEDNGAYAVVYSVEQKLQKIRIANGIKPPIASFCIKMM